MHFDAAIRMPYKWSTGAVYGRFLSGLRQGELWSVRCLACDAVSLPPATTCRWCGSEDAEWSRSPDEGRIVAAYRTQHTFPGGPEAPYVVAIIELDDSARIVHHVPLDHTDAVGERVRARWRPERSGSVLDIECFTKGEQ